MAASILRVGRLSAFKCLQLERCGILRSCSAVSFCSQTGEPEKPVKKTKASRKTDAPNERAALLAYKTAVTFPVRLSEPGFFPAQSLGETEPVVSPTAAEKIVAFEVTSAATAESEAAAPISDSVPATSTPVVDTAPQTVDLLAETSRKSSTPDNTPVTDVAQGVTIPVPPAFSESRDAAADLSSSSSSSSSSDSDSDSDTDTEDEKLHVNTETSTSQPVVEEPTIKEVHNVTEVIKDTNEACREPEPAPSSSSVEAVQEATAASEAAKATMEPPVESLKDLAPKICIAAKNVPEMTTPEDASPDVDDATSEAAYEAQDDSVDNVLDPEEAPGAPVETLNEDPPAGAAPEPAEVAPEPAEVALEPAEVAPEPAEAAPEPAEAAPEPAEAAPEPAEAAPEPARTMAFNEAITEAAAEVTSSSAEELADPAPIITEAVGEELQTAGPVDQSEEAAQEPEEPFDNSTYKNYQHHNYNPYTFADMDMEMAKFRLPQPSSGRPSPRH